MSGFPVGSAAATLAKLPVEQKTTLPPQDELRLRQASRDFESLFVNQMLKSMRSAIPKDPEGGLIKEGQGEKIFREMLDSEYANMMSQRGRGIGLGETMFKQLVARYKSPASDGASIQENAQASADRLKSAARAVDALSYGQTGSGKPAAN